MNQRWLNKRGSFVSDNEIINPREFEIVELRKHSEAKRFVEEHHYSGSVPTIIRCFGLLQGSVLASLRELRNYNQGATMKNCPHCAGSPAMNCSYCKDVVTHLVTPQPPPLRNTLPAVWDLVKRDMEARDNEGRRKYGVPLQPHNGRDPLIDLYQELLDAVAYCRQAIFERDGK